MKTLLLTLLVSVAVVGFSFAENAVPKAKSVAPGKVVSAAKVSMVKVKMVRGTVESVDTAKNTIKVKTGKGEAKEMTVAADASLTNGKAKVGLADVAAGESVLVSFEMKDGAMEAKSIKVLPAKKKAAAK
jgi:hypothetical protein